MVYYDLPDGTDPLRPARSCAAAGAPYTVHRAPTPSAVDETPTPSLFLGWAFPFPFSRVSSERPPDGRRRPPPARSDGLPAGAAGPARSDPSKNPLLTFMLESDRVSAARTRRDRTWTAGAMGMAITAITIAAIRHALEGARVIPMERGRRRAAAFCMLRPSQKGVDRLW